MMLIQHLKKDEVYNQKDAEGFIRLKCFKIYHCW